MRLETVSDAQTIMNPSTDVLTRPPKSPGTNTLGGKKVISMTSAPPTPSLLPPPRPYPLKRSVSAPLSRLQKQQTDKERDDPPLQVKIYDGFGDDRSGHDDTLNLSWLESTLEPSFEEKKEDNGQSQRKHHRRGRAFSWDGGGLMTSLYDSDQHQPQKAPKTPCTPATEATEPTSSPESSPESSCTEDPTAWSLNDSRRKVATTKSCLDRRGKPPKASPPLPFSRKVAGAETKPKPTTVMSRGEVHERVSMCLKNGDYETALSLSDNILQEDQKRYGHHHASVGIALHNIGMVHLHASRYDMSESIFYQAVLVRKNALGPEHLDVAASLTKLGSVRLQLRRFDGSLAAFWEALRISRKHLGYGHSSVAQLQSHIGCVYFEVGEYVSAQATFEDALYIYRTLWASGIDVDAAVWAVTEMLCNVGSIQSKRKHYYGAIASFSEALDLQRRIMQEENPRVFATLDNLGHAFAKNKNYDQALACYKELLRVQVAFYGTYNEDCYRTAKKQNLLYEKQQKYGSSHTPASPAIDSRSSGIPMGQ